MKRRNFLKNASLFGMAPFVPTHKEFGNIEKKGKNTNHRTIWLNYLVNLSDPVLKALAADQLKAKMPNEIPKNVLGDRSKYAPLEAFGRLFAGIAPWLQLDEMNKEEKAIHDKYFALTLKGIEHAVNPSAKDYFNWVDEGQAYAQPLVDASYFAYGFIRCPKIWKELDNITQERVKERLLATREIRPGYNNWLLFSAMIEAFFVSIGEPYDIMRIDYALRQHEQWYVGGGFYSDGSNFHYDYYNSFVIHPYLRDIVDLVVQKDKGYEAMRKQIHHRNDRYAIFQEAIVAPDGTYPPMGRSIVYRTGAFQHLAMMSLKKALPGSMMPAQARCALTAVISKITDPEDLFDAKGWLQFGLYGHQPSLADIYISTGSLYLCANILLPLGLPETDRFWSMPDEDWSARKMWKGTDMRHIL